MEQVAQWAGTLIGLAVWSLIGAVIVQCATLAIAKYKLDYWHAYRVTFVGTGVGMLLSEWGAVMLPALEVGTEGALQFLPVVLGTLLQGYLYGLLIKVPDLGGIGLRKGLLVALVQLIVGLLAVGGFMWIAVW